ncbi:MAG: transcription elongation factor GreA [Lachnospiraceae bacterium]|nr:transcription elongation factor GreA [Lachnospiraceae bacterium]
MRDKLTRSDIKKMQEEIEYREFTLRPKLLESVKEARSHGDLSENFEYHAAKKEKNINESRIRYLERMIKSAVLIDDSSKEDEVGINNRVRIYFEEDDEEEEFKLVTTVRTNSLKGLISIESPLGKAIFKKKLGDRVLVKVSEEISYYVVIKDIDNSTDDSMDEINRY